jgi:SAM-dependent methyltransferase
MCDAIEFRRDLYCGTASSYDGFRVSYPPALVDRVLDSAAPNGGGRLLDLACGTGQISFAMFRRFQDVWAVDQEPDMIEIVRRKAAAAKACGVRPIVSRAETLDAPAGAFELVAIGNAFHRLERETVAANVFRWLQPGRCVALMWASSPWVGEEDWQSAMAAVFERWKERVAVQDRVPAGWERARQQLPDSTLLARSGFEPVGSYSFPTGYEWTIDALTGFVYSTSFLPRAVLVDQSDAFEADLRLALDRYAIDGKLRETIDFACELARRPG